MLELRFDSLEQFRDIDRAPLLVMRDWRRQGLRCALLTIVAIDGRSPRSVGAQMVVNEQGGMHGYLTGGCLEAELALVGQKAITDGRNVLHRYGKGSPFIDIKLPCGSGIDILFDQGLNDEVLFEAASLIEQRQYFKLVTDMESGHSSIKLMTDDAACIPQENAQGIHFERLCKPSLHLNLYGAGFAAVQIAYLAQISGVSVSFYVGDKITVAGAAALGVKTIDMGEGRFTPPSTDKWTASMLAFHEHEREIPILKQLVTGPDFYIGTIGSALVAAQRQEALREEGVPVELIARITMSAGLVPGARNATELAAGVVAEFLAVARKSGLRI